MNSPLNISLRETINKRNLVNQLPGIIIQETSNTSQNPKNLEMVVERLQTKKILILKEVPKIADMDFMGDNKTQIVISESAMVKRPFDIDI